MIKIEITTCEQYVLAELEDAKRMIDDLENKVEELSIVSDMLAAVLNEYDPDWMRKVFKDPKVKGGGGVPS